MSTYPKLILIDKDSVVCFLPWQVKYINDTYILGSDECQERSKALRTIVDSAARTIDLQSAVIANQDQQLLLDADMVDKQKKLLKISDKEIAALNRKNTWNKWERNGLLAATAYLVLRFIK